MQVLETYLVFTIILEATSAQFLEQPDPGILFAPVEYEVTLTCSVEEGYLIDWHVLLPDGKEADASSGIASQVLMGRNFTLEGVLTTRSTLSLRETENQKNNGTNITCITQETGAQRATMGNVVQVIFYAGAPPPPTNLSVTEDYQDHLNITWSLMVIEGVPVNYTLTVLNLNTTSAQPIIIAGLLDQHYVFETSRPCDVYSFTVTAMTAAGNSTPSQEIIFVRNGNRAICFATTSESKVSSNQHTASFTSFSLPITHTDSTQPLTTSSSPTQDNSTTVLIAAVSIAFAVLMTVLVLVNVMICVFCYKKNKTEVKSDRKDPVYEAPYDVAMLPSLAENRGTPFAMTSSSAYDATGDTQKLPLKDSSPSKSSKKDTESSYAPFAMKSSTAYEISKNSQNLPREIGKNLSPSKSSKIPGSENSHVPFEMTSSLISKNPQNLDTEDKLIFTTLSTDDEPSKSTDSASDTVPFTMTSSLAYEVSKNHDSKNEIVPTASPSANESSEKLDIDVPFTMTSSLAYEVSKNHDSKNETVSTASPSANESSEKLDIDVPFTMTSSLAYEVSKNHKNFDSEDKTSSTASSPADESSKKLDTIQFDMTLSLAYEVSKNCKNHDSDNKIISPSTADESSQSLNTECSSIPFHITPSLACEVSKNLKNFDSDNEIASPLADDCSKKLDTVSSTVLASSADGVPTTPRKHLAKSPDNSTSSSFSAYKPAKILDTDDYMAD